jgi:hypothetical protein
MERVGYGAGSIPDWVLRQRANLWEWKGRRLAADLRLVGSVWEDEETGGILEFGADGRMRWQRFPEVGRREWESVEAVVRKLEGTRYKEEDHAVIYPGGFGPLFGPSEKVGVRVGLSFPDHSDFLAKSGYFGDHLYFHFWDTAVPFVKKSLIFTRRIDP